MGYIAATPTVADLLTKSKIHVGLAWRDDLIAVDCTTCASPARLDQCRQIVKDDRRTYSCPGCKEPLLTIRRPYAYEAKTAMHGYRLGNHVLINLGPVRLNGFGRLLLPVIVDAAVIKSWLGRIAVAPRRPRMGH